MDPVEKAISLFHQSIAARADNGELLAAQLADASELIAATLVNNGRILLCGHGNSTLQVQQFSSLLLGQHQRERPGLPAISLNACVATLTTISESYGPNEVFARQIRALGQDGDTLVIYTTTGDPQSLVNAVQAAHERNIKVLCFGGSESGNLAQLLSNEDIDIQAPGIEDYLVHDLHQLMTTVLCDLIEDQLFGGVS